MKVLKFETKTERICVGSKYEMDSPESSAYITTESGIWIAHFGGEPEWVLEAPNKRELHFKRNYDWDKLFEFLINKKHNSTYMTYDGTTIRISTVTEPLVHVVGILNMDAKGTRAWIKQHKANHAKKDLRLLCTVDELMLVLTRLSTEYW